MRHRVAYQPQTYLPKELRYLVKQWGGPYADSRDQYAWMDLNNHLFVITMYLSGTGQHDLADLYRSATEQAAARASLAIAEGEAA